MAFLENFQVIAISHFGRNHFQFSDHEWQKWLQYAKKQGATSIMIREGNWSEEIKNLAFQIASNFFSNVILHSGNSSSLSKIIHQSSKHQGMPIPGKINGISTHNALEIQNAIAKGYDYVFLSPVLWTKSHLEEQALGWQRFQEFAKKFHIPIIALGGMTMAHVQKARESGASGIAAIGAFQNFEA